MLPFLGDFIQKQPMIVVIVILMITIGFSLYIPAIEFKTDFDEFTPDDEIVLANTRIQEYFGENTQLLFMYVTNENGNHVLTSESLREMFELQKELETNPDVQGSYSIVTFLDMICFIEYGKSLMDCTDDQLQTALRDLLITENIDEITFFMNDDPNEEIDYKRFPRLSRGTQVDYADIKNGHIIKDEENITFSIELYDIIDMSSELSPVFPKVHVMEWYVSFNNLITPVESLNISYTLAAHIEPSQPLWNMGDGMVDNLRSLLTQMRTGALFRSYKKEVYLWVQLSGQTSAFPIRLSSGNIVFNTEENMVDITVSLDELSTYGIAPQLGSFALPAKLSDFEVGSRYYQTGLFNRGGGRVSANTSVLINTLFGLHERPLLGRITDSLMQRYGNITWQEFEEYYALLDSTDMISETLALKDFENNWIQADIASDTSDSIDCSFSIIPAFYQDIQLSLRSFVSKDFDERFAPSSTLILLELALTKDYAELIAMNTGIADDIYQIDATLPSIETKVTGTGITSAEINELTTQANQFIAPAIFLIIVAVLYLNFRRFSYVILPMLSLVVSTIWLFGAMALMGISFNVISIALVPLILGLGVDYSVHLFHNYRVELSKGKKPGEAIKKSVSEIGTAMFLAMITTVIAFLSFLTASVPPIRDFGILLALGVTFTFITSITLLAALRFLLDSRRTVVLKRKQQGLAVQNIMRKLSEKVLCYQRSIFVIMVGITIFFSYGATQIETGYDIDQFAPTDTPAFELFDVIAEEFPFSSQTQNYILLEGDVATVKALEGIRQTHERLKDDTYVAKNTDGSLKVSSIYSYIEQAVKNNKSIIERFHMNPVTLIPSSDSNVYALFNYLFSTTSEETMSSDMMDEMMPEEMNLTGFSLEAFNGELKTVLYQDQGEYTATCIRINLDSSFTTLEGNINDALETVNTEITESITSYGAVDAIATGPSLINLQVTNNLTDSQVLSTIVSIILASIVLIVVYRNPTLGLITLIPVGISIIWILGTMYFIGYTLNVLTITVTSITIGIGIDYAIHATERFRFIVDKTGDITKAVCETISHTGGALLIAALTTALGFIILVFAPIPPQQQFGLILSITIVYSFLTSIFLLPLVIYRWAIYQQKKKGYVVTGNGNHILSRINGNNNDCSCTCKNREENK